MGRLSLQGAYTEVWGTTRGCRRSRASARNPDRAHTRVHTFTFTIGITCCRLSTCRPQAKSLNRHRAHSRPNRLFDYTTFLFFSPLFLSLSFLCLLLAFLEPRWADKNSSSSSLSNVPLSGEDVSINLSKETRTRRFCSIFKLRTLLEIALTLWIFFFSFVKRWFADREEIRVRGNITRWLLII